MSQDFLRFLIELGIFGECHADFKCVMSQVSRVFMFACFRFQVDVCKDMNVADVMQHALMDTSSSLARYRIYGSTASLNTLVTSSSRALLDPAAKASRLLHTRHLSMDEIEVPPCLTGASCLHKILHLECCCGGGRFRRCWSLE